MADRAKGLARLKRQLAGLPNSMRAAAADALEKNAAEGAAAVKRAVPKRSGRLAQTVGYTAGAPPKGALAAPTVGGFSAPALKEAGLFFTIHAGDERAYYARFVEFGTSAAPAGAYKDRKGKTRTNQREHKATPAQPFFFPTIRANKKRWRGRVVRATNKAAKAAAALR